MEKFVMPCKETSYQELWKEFAICLLMFMLLLSDSSYLFPERPCEDTQTQLQTCAADVETQLMPASNTRHLKGTHSWGVHYMKY